MDIFKYIHVCKWIYLSIYMYVYGHIYIYIYILISNTYDSRGPAHTSEVVLVSLSALGAISCRTCLPLSNPH